mmetsp:Transcript_46666/g.148082  ORF Transcript_46666/g.148082 Transcript_46666/m.148082 type:complete len:242 (-) Transcript_46666:428-1153(-)
MRGKEQRWSHCRPALDLRIPPHEVVRFAQHPPEVGRAHAHRAEEAVRLLHKLAVERAHQREAGEEGVPPLLHRLERVEEGELAEWIVSAVALAQLDQRRVVAAELLVLRPHHLALKGRLLPAEGRRRHRLRARQLRHHIRLPRRRLLGGRAEVTGGLHTPRGASRQGQAALATPRPGRREAGMDCSVEPAWRRAGRGPLPAEEGEASRPSQRPSCCPPATASSRPPTPATRLAARTTPPSP